jgi:hypothetical protein
VIERLYKSDIMKIFPHKDWRTNKEWCRNNGVAILFDKGSKQCYVIKEEFEEAIDKVPKEYLMKKFNQDNVSVLNSSIAFCAQCQYAIDNNRSSKSHDYKIEGEHGKRFLSILKNKLNELPSESDGKSVTHSQNKAMERPCSLLPEMQYECGSLPNDGKKIRKLSVRR